MADENEKFLSRWSRLKREAQEHAAEEKADEGQAAADAAPPELPPVEELSFDSDYRGFFHPKIDEDTRRAALKKLFSDARFNVIDEMDIDIEDYSKYPPLSAAVVASLKQAQNILEWAREREEGETAAKTRVAEPSAPEQVERETEAETPPSLADAGTEEPADAPDQRPEEPGAAKA